MLAGVAWAATLVNMSCPEVGEWILRDWPADQREKEPLVAGVLSAVAMRHATAPMDESVAIAIRHWPTDRAAAWQTFVQAPFVAARERLCPSLLRAPWQPRRGLWRVLTPRSRGGRRRGLLAAGIGEVSTGHGDRAVSTVISALPSIHVSNVSCSETIRSWQSSSSQMSTAKQFSPTVARVLFGIENSISNMRIVPILACLMTSRLPVQVFVAWTNVTVRPSG